MLLHILANLAKHGLDSRKNAKHRAAKDDKQRTKTPTEQLSDNQEKKRLKRGKSELKTSSKSS